MIILHLSNPLMYQLIWWRNGEKKYRVIINMPFSIIIALNVTTDNCVLKVCGCCTIKPTFTAVLVMYYILILNAWCIVQSDLSVSLFLPEMAIVSHYGGGT